MPGGTSPASIFVLVRTGAALSTLYRLVNASGERHRADAMAEAEGRRGEWARRPPNEPGRRTDRSLGAQPSLALLLREGGGYLLQARYLSVRGHLIDKFRKVLRQLRQKIFLRHASLLRSLADSVLP